MKKLEGRDMITHLMIARKVNEIIDLLDKKGLLLIDNPNDNLKKVANNGR